VSIDTAAPRTRRAVIAGAFGALLGTLGMSARPAAVRAGMDGDLVLEATNNTDALTELVATNSTALRVVGGGTALQAWGDIAVDAFGDIAVNAISDATSAPASIGFNRGNSVGVLGWSADGNESTPAIPARTGVFGLATQDANARGVVGKSDSGQGVRGQAVSGIGVVGISSSGIAIDGQGSLAGVRGTADQVGVEGFSSAGPGVVGASGDPLPPVTLHAKTGVYGIAATDALSQGVFGETTAGAGVLGRASTGHGVRGESDAGPGVFGTNDSASVGSIVGDGGAGTGVHGHGGGGTIPDSPPTTGVYGTATAAGTGVFGDATAGAGVRGWATTGDGVSAKATTGVATRAVATGGIGVHGEATTGVGVKAVATTGTALDVGGRAVFSRSGRANVPPGAKRVDVTVPGGLDSNANVLATLQIRRAKVHVIAARPNYPSAGKVRIYLSDIASPTAATPLAWFVIG
jgi:hypothetical protein